MLPYECLSAGMAGRKVERASCMHKIRTFPASMPRLKKGPTLKSTRAEVAGRWCSRYLGVSNTNGFTKGL